MAASYPRYRFSSSMKPSFLRIVTQEAPLPAPSTDFSFQGKDVGSLEEMYDTVTPGFDLIRKSGGIVNNSMKKHVRKYEYSTGTWNGTKHPLANEPTDHVTYSRHIGAYLDFHASTGNFVGLVPHLRMLTNPVRGASLASIEARARVSPVYVQSIVSVAELHKTVDLVASTVVKLRRFRQAIVRGDGYNILRRIVGRNFKHNKPSKDIASSTSSRWLEYRYGWLPLVYEVQGAVKALSPTREFKTRAVARGRKEFTRKESWNAVHNGLFGSMGNFTFKYEQDEKLSCRAYCLFEADLRFQTARDFGVTEVPLALWELVPFSFVVDWFVNVGDWITAMTPKLGVNILAEGVTVEHNRSIKRTIVGWSSGGTSGGFWQVSNAVGSLTDVYTENLKTRTPNLTNVFSFPPIDVKLNVKRVADALALLAKLR